MPDTPGPVPALTEATRLRTDIGTVVKVGGFLAMCVISWTIIYLDVQGLKEAKKEQTEQMRIMAEQMVSLRDEVRALRWTIDPPLSRPVIANQPKTYGGRP